MSGERHVEDLRHRTVRQVEQAARLRGEAAPPTVPLDVLDVEALQRLVAAHPGAHRSAEWRLFLGELRLLAADDGRLPARFERLVRVVLAELIEAR